jgi:hypothetical protein
VLEAMLYAGNGRRQGERRKAEPDWAHVHHELRRPGITLMLLWEEYRQREPDGYGYSRWCELYRAWEGRLSPTMRQAHPAGERMFVDYAGQTVDVVDPGTGEVRPAQIFIAVLGASNFTYAEASWTQRLADWIGAHVRALAFMGGVPAQLVPVAVVVRQPGGIQAEHQTGIAEPDLGNHWRVPSPRMRATASPGIVVQDRLRHAAENGEGGIVPVQKGLDPLGRVGFDKAGIRVRQVQAEKVDLLPHAADHRHRLAEIGLGMTGRVGQRHEHFLRLGTMLAHIVLHARIAAGITVLGAPALENALGRVSLLRRRGTPAARRHREGQHLACGITVDPEAPRWLRPSTWQAWRTRP